MSERIREVIVTVEVETNKRTLRSAVSMNEESREEYQERVKARIDELLDEVVDV